MFKGIATTLAVFFIVLSTICSAQVTATGSKLSVGGDFSLLFGSLTLVNISPKVGYRFSDRFMAGPGVIYQYYKDTRDPNFMVSSSILGVSGFGRYVITENIAAYSEYQQLQYTAEINGSAQVFRVPVWFVGGQLTSSLGSGFNLNLSVLFDVLEGENSPYPNPYYGVGGFYNF